MATPLIIGEQQRAALQALRDLAAAHPVDMPALIERLKTKEGKASHAKQMTAQTIEIPMGFYVTYSVETGHPAGTCRHMSMSISVKGRVPAPDGVWMVAEELGFTGGLPLCCVYLEDLERGGASKDKAVNVVQPLNVLAARHV